MSMLMREAQWTDSEFRKQSFSHLDSVPNMDI